LLDGFPSLEFIYSIFLLVKPPAYPQAADWHVATLNTSYP
jgi:hypothetical protein